ncbi:thiamine phosphate synthase [Sphingobacterium puteale]|uniref:Thiamine phosphate synthase n=1 Tax=Sphingobacterium puteale TaxID=2420510 RepID=A0A420W2N1_9SPHI|nr:thiamine phosphate synthase [Sphingobacterium puteale]RKO72810.1 thiamine phosphate synthase [Sphingobacterium puteale]
MIIALTAAEEVAPEMDIIHHLFEQGLDLLHLRKYHFTDEQMYRYVESIDATYRDRLVLHSHPQLSDALQIGRIHFNEHHRQSGLFDRHHFGNIYSTSVHHISQFNALDTRWNYAFLSPLFPSISKIGYGRENALLNQLPLRSNFDVRLIGLGGIAAANCLLPFRAGANGIALLGALWQDPDPIQHFITCKQLCSKNYNISPRD